MTVLRNRDRVLVAPDRVAHRPAPMKQHTACGAARGQRLEAMTFAQAFVWVKPSWCLRPVCFPGGEPR
jgi:hypothetical protein